MSSSSSIEKLVNIIKQDVFSNLDHEDDDNAHRILSASAYETAWLAMVPHPDDHSRPFFECCVNWVLNNQNKLGFWGEYSEDSVNGSVSAAIDSLPSILACLIALHKWNVGHNLIQKGLKCMHANLEILAQIKCQNLPRRFSIVFPTMVDLAKSTTNLDLDFPEHVENIISSILNNRQQLLEMEEMGDMYEYFPLISYSEASKHKVDDEQNIKVQTSEYFQYSPSATAQEFLLTGNHKFMNYLVSLVQKYPDGVPPVNPMNEELIKLCIVNHVQRLGLAEYFKEEIEGILQKIYRNYESNQEQQNEEFNFVPNKIYKDSLAFRILRMNGYNSINPWKFCWFLHDEKIMAEIEQNYEVYMGLMYNIYRATDIILPGENELEEARSISKNFLEKSLILRNNCDDKNVFTFPIPSKLIENELSVAWIARLDHLDHRSWIEQHLSTSLCFNGVGSFNHRMQSCYNANLMRLAVQNYEFRQSIYMKELEELKKWSQEWGLSEMGFGREKTSYSYFAAASSCSQMPVDSVMRMIIAKSSIIITVADDFYDMKISSSEELQALTQAIHMWKCEGLSGHGEIIFKALENLVSEIGGNYIHQDSTTITQIIQDIWRDTFESWMKESEWSINGYLPSIDEYLETGMTSISVHTLVLPSSILSNNNIPNYKLKAAHFDAITKLLMVMARILNDVQSYEKEEKEGKMNLVSIMKKINGNADNLSAVRAIEDVVLDELRKEFLKRVFIDEINDLPKDFKLLHLSCLKVFQMFFNATNRFDTETDLLHDINRAIYLPINNRIPKSMKLYAQPSNKTEKTLLVTNRFNQITLKSRTIKVFSQQNFLKKTSVDGYKKVCMVPKVHLSFI